MVYFITDKKNIKIGYSKNPNKRIKQLNTGNAKKLILIGYVNGDKNKEKELHCQFSQDRLNGEWFSPSNEILDFINDNLSQIYVEKNTTINVYQRMSK